METRLRRLYVGGIGPSVTDAELSERFGRFGKVDEVDVISRRDEQGNPIKTFAYMNINISDAELKKCLSVLNKSKWKGGVLQIELAKESFLHKLELERQAAKEKKNPKQPNHPQDDLLQSLEKVGVTDFQMKAAVPGTEVPNHKNWVVSKYGRVLPVLHLKESTKNKMMKYDPSKYCHNLKKLDGVSAESRPVSQLTWHLDAGDDDISKKRRGEFPEFKSPVKRSKINSSLNTNRTAKTEKNLRTPPTSLQVTEDTLGSPHRRDIFQDKSRGYMGNKSISRMSDDEYDSEEELKTILEKEKMLKESRRQAEDFNIEVVDDSFTPSYQTHWEIGKHWASKSSAKDDNGYDSADTDEIITVAKTAKNCDGHKKEKPKAPLKQNGNVVSKNQSTSKFSDKCEDDNSSTEEEGSSNESDAKDDSDSYSDEEYESLMQNCYRLDLSMGDLEALVKEAGGNTSENSDSDQKYDSSDIECVLPQTVGELKGSESKRTSKAAHARDLKPGNSSNTLSSENTSSEGEGESKKQDQAHFTVPKLKSVEKSMLKSCSENDKTDVANKGENTVTKVQKGAKSDNAAVAGNLKRKKGIEPEDIVASILEEDDDDSSNDQPKRKKKKSPINKPPAFKGLGSMMSSYVSETKAPQSSSRASAQPTTVVAVCEKTEANTSSSKSKVKGDSKDNEIRPKPVKKILPSVHQTREKNGGSSSSSSISSDEESSSSTSSDTKPKVFKASSYKEQSNSKAKQLQDNQKRLAAMEERRKEREQQKQTIQGALLKLDSQSEKKSQHIVFNSESEEESEKEEEASTSHVNNDKKTSQVKAKLFDSSGEESDDEEEKEDERFEIKKQYEGRSGAKLMQLQSRFGTDERFKMDARFLEDGSEGEDDTDQSQNIQEDDDGLLAEKKKNLDILQSILNINVQQQPTSKKEAKAKKFKDPNALLYDPTKEDHAVFETKVEEEKKASKSEKKKKRLEADKLPEVSKDIFHEVTTDFKEVFGATKPQATEEQEMTWDQMEELQKEEVESSVSNVDLSFQKTEESGGFTFSFFGTSTDENVSHDEPYRIENIKSAKVAWQEDPRFQDSSSEEEDGGEEEEDTTVTAISSSSQNSSNIRFFFFVKDDTRLKEGPKMFFRSSKSEQKAKDWDDMKDTFIEDCKKRHRDAKRKLKSGQ